MRARSVAVCLLVGADRELGNMAVHRALRHIEANMSTAGAAFLGADQWQVDCIGDEIRFQQQAFLFAFIIEIIRLARKAILEIVLRIENEADVFIQVDHRRTIRDGDEACRVLAGPVEMLAVGIERDRKQRACLPLERHALTGVIPHRA